MVNMNVSEIFSCERNKSLGKDNFELSTLGYILLDFILCVFVGFGNILVLVAFSKFQELRTNRNVFVVGLALVDLSLALIAVPLHTAILVFPVIKTVFLGCILRYCTVTFAAGSSGILLIVISLDRYFAIEKPLEYSRNMTSRLAKLVTIGVLVFTLAFSSLPVLGWNEWSPCGGCKFSRVLPHLYLTVIVLVILIGVALVGILNIKIFFTANKAAKDIRMRMVSFPGQSSVVNGNGLIQNKRAIKALLMMSGAYTICLLPLGIFILWQINSLDKTVHQKYSALQTVITVLTFVNSGLNPLIYHLRMPEFNSAFRRLLCRKAKVGISQREQIQHTTKESRKQPTGPPSHHQLT